MKVHRAEEEFEAPVIHHKPPEVDLEDGQIKEAGQDQGLELDEREATRETDLQQEADLEEETFDQGRQQHPLTDIRLPERKEIETLQLQKIEPTN